MKRVFIYLLTLLLLTGKITSGQTSNQFESKDKKKNTELITGIWVINKMDDGKKRTKEEEEKLKKEMIKIKEGSFFNFMNTGHYEMCLVLDDVAFDKGKWRVSTDGKYLITTQDTRVQDEMLEIKKITKTNCTLQMTNGLTKITLELIKGDSVLNQKQMEARRMGLMVYEKINEEINQYKEKMIKDSTDAVNMAYQDAMEAMKKDSMNKKKDINVVDSLDPDGNFRCVFLGMLIKCINDSSCKLKGEFISKNDSENYYKCLLYPVSANRIYYTYRGNLKYPIRFNRFFGEDLTERDATVLFEKELAKYNECEGSKWKEMHKGKNKYSNRVIEKTPVSIQMNYNKEKKNYSVVLVIYSRYYVE